MFSAEERAMRRYGGERGNMGHGAGGMPGSTDNISAADISGPVAGKSLLSMLYGAGRIDVSVDSTATQRAEYVHSARKEHT